ncbi:MAG: DHH family phosphoesterase [Clostridiaceae bacterium]|jgi:nanoRNase/pAp phosphatase (c-di-AMP/oligoRNAs hydrolase)|nr:DHH family phosphoesterase [Clostridiaceae bacterium]
MDIIKKEKTGNLQKLIDIISQSGQRILIQMHNSPDPDSIASAYGLQYLLQNAGIQADICYRGEIEKYSTSRMVELLGIKLKNITEIPDMTENDYIILVDSQKGNANITDFIGNEIASIDHHPTFHKIDYLFQDIRPDVGACSSIIAEYFVENDVEMPRDVATALIYGLKTDTLDLSRGVSKLDIDMFYMLYRSADIELLNLIQLNQLQFCDLMAYSNAIKNIRIFNNMGIADIGADCPDSLLGTVSDFVMSLKEVELSVVYSSRKGGVKFSVRNETSHLDAGKIIMTVLDGIGSGGGHKSMAGGFVPQAAAEALGTSFHSFIENRIIDALREY